MLARPQTPCPGFASGQDLTDDEPWKLMRCTCGCRGHSSAPCYRRLTREAIRLLALSRVARQKLEGAFGLCGREELIGMPGLDDLTVIHKDDPARDVAREAHLVGHD